MAATLLLLYYWFVIVFAHLIDNDMHDVRVVPHFDPWYTNAPSVRQTRGMIIIFFSLLRVIMRMGTFLRVTHSLPVHYHLWRPRGDW